MGKRMVLVPVPVLGLEMVSTLCLILGAGIPSPEEKWLWLLVPPGLVSCSISKLERGVNAGEMPEPFSVFQMTLENVM